MKAECGEARVRKALQRLQHVSLTTSFTGSGLAEIHVQALAALEGVEVRLGPGLDWDHHVQKLLSHRFPDRCIFSDIKDVVKTFKRGTSKRPPSCSALRDAWCCTHNRKCHPGQPAVTDTEGLRIEIAGPCCPPWSAFGKHLGTQDERYESHEVSCNGHANHFF